MVSGKTKSGFEFSIPEGLSNDFLFVRAYRKMVGGDGEEALDGAADLVSVIFADDKEEERFYKHLAKLHGSRVPMDIMFEELTEIITIAGEQDANIKNS